MRVGGPLDDLVFPTPEGPVRVKDGHGFSFGFVTSLGRCSATEHGVHQILQGATASDPYVEYQCLFDGSAYGWEAVATVATADATYVSKAGDTMTGMFEVANSGPILQLNETDAGADEKRWQVLASAANFIIRMLNDAGAGAIRMLAFNRVGVASGGIFFNPDSIDMDFTYRSDTLTQALFIDGGTGEPRLQYLAGTGDRLVQADAQGDLSATVRILTGSTTVDPASTAAGGSWATTVTVTGAAVGDVALPCAHTTLPSAFDWESGMVSAADTVRCVFRNNTGGLSDPGSGTLRAVVLKLP